MNQLPPPLQGLAAFAQFLNYITVPGAKKARKIPTNAQGVAVDPTDPRHWMTAEQALASGLGVAFQFTASDPFFFLDVDGALQADGKWSPLAMELLGRFEGCAVEVSHSGTGLHIIGIGDPGPHSCRFDSLGLEFYTQDRFVALTGSGALGDCLHVADGAQLQHVVSTWFPTRKADDHEWTDGPVAEWRGPTDDDDLIRRASRVQSAASVFGHKASFVDLWEGDADKLALAFPTSGDSVFDRSSADGALAAHLAFWTGKDCERILRLMMLSGLRRDKYDREDYMLRTITGACGVTSTVCQDKPLEAVHAEVGEAGLAEVQLVQGSTYVRPDDQVKMFQGCVYVRSLGRVWTPAGELLKPEAFRVLFGGFRFVLDDMGEKVTDDAFKALTNNPMLRVPQVATVGFDPKEPPGAVMRNYRGKQALNTWIEPVVRSEAGDLGPFTRHMEKVLPDARDRAVLMAWMAALVQYPGHKFGWSPVLQGVEGNGKSFFSYACEHAVSPMYTHWPRVVDLKNPQFNAWMSGKLLACVEDVYSSSPDFFENLKPLITGETQTIEKKGVDADTEKIFCNLIFNMNNKAGLKKSRNDRRLAVFHTGQQEKADLERDGMGPAYMRDLYDWAKGNGAWADKGPNYGFAVIAHALLHHQIPDDLNPTKLAARAPDTTASAAAVAASMGPREQDLQDAIDSEEIGFRGGWVSSYYALERLRTRTKFGATPSALDQILEALGFVRHPGLGDDGRPNNKVSPDNSRSRLYVKRSRLDLLAVADKSEVARKYSEAQNAS